MCLCGQAHLLIDVSVIFVLYVCLCVGRGHVPGWPARKATSMPGVAFLTRLSPCDGQPCGPPLAVPGSVTEKEGGLTEVGGHLRSSLSDAFFPIRSQELGGRDSGLSRQRLGAPRPPGAEAEGSLGG